MRVRDFLRADFDVNTNVKIYDCSKEQGYRSLDNLVYRGFGSPDDAEDEVLNLQISYVTTDSDCIVIEAIFDYMSIKVYDIEWDVSGEDAEDIDLPKEVTIDGVYRKVDYLDENSELDVTRLSEDIFDWLSEKYGFMVECCVFDEIA